MGINSAIEWTDHTFNAWVGCTKLSAACDHCYAETWARRTGSPKLWEGERRRTSAAYWKQPIKWNAAAAKTETRARVFCCSLADVFDNQADPQWRVELFSLIQRTPNLEWQLLTKRPQNIIKMCEAAGGLPSNAAIGTTVENQEQADIRIPALLEAAAKVRPLYTFLSCEPLLGPIKFNPCRHCNHEGNINQWPCPYCKHRRFEIPDWVICGGESGAKARPMHPQWARSLRDQCAAAGVPFFFKQWGNWIPHKPVAGGDLGGDVRAGRARIVHPTGQSDVEVSEATGGRSTIPGSRYMENVGKKAAGRSLDGRTHNEFPRGAG